MARKLRVEYPGAVYHVLSRGDRREAIFKDDHDRNCFLETLEDACAKTNWQVHAYCFMPNHFHLVVETPSANLVVGMKWLLGTYTGRFNRRHKTTGHLFSGRYKALIIDGSGNGYLKTVCDYVHLNPHRARLVGPRQPLSRFRWSSYPLYLATSQPRPPWLRVEPLLGEHGIPKDSTAGRRKFEQIMESRRGIDQGEEFKAVRRGWYLGGGQFRNELLAQMKERRGPNHYGPERVETDEAKAMNIIEQELKERRWTVDILKERRKGDKEKIKMARRLRDETAMTLKWIAEKLVMGSWSYAGNLLAKTKAKV